VAQVVAVHGVGKQVLGEESLLKDWLPALRDGVRRVEGPLLGDGAVAMAFYGDLFRPAGQLLAVGDPRFTANDVAEGLEQELLLAWWEEAARTDDAVAPPDADTLARTPRSVQAALRALSRSRFFSDIALRSLVFDLKQVSGYLQDPGLRAAARARVCALIGEETRVVIGHSLGSVVAYEALCALPGHGVRSLVTLGSPLGIGVIYARLEPGGECWPGGESLAWTNLADAGDVVALFKDLRAPFGERVRNAVVHNGSHAHDATAYLTDELTGRAVAGGLDAQ
jgi:hypothetical protein